MDNLRRHIEKKFHLQKTGTEAGVHSPAIFVYRRRTNKSNLAIKLKIQILMDFWQEAGLYYGHRGFAAHYEGWDYA